MNFKPIIIVAGDPKSIFFEIFFKTIKKKRIKSPLILICNINLLKKSMYIYNCKKKINFLKDKKLDSKILNNETINILNIEINTANKIENHIYRDYIKKSFETAFKLIQKGLTYKLLNGPINKKKFLNKKFAGMTEFISSYFKKNNTGMLIYNKKLSVCPLTTHLPLKQVANKITKKLISKKIELINDFFIRQLKIKPKIAVTGLNPHCESISKINEDESIIFPVIQNKIKKGINVNGPYPADTIFLKKNRKKFNVILGMYHDQVLSPIKTLFEYDAINITMGLPFLRVSPDHGPNEKMVNKNLSNPTSLYKALEFLDKN